MDNNTKQTELETLSEIRSLMERSTRFISLSGMSGIVAGITATVGAVFTYWRLKVLGIKLYENDELLLNVSYSVILELVVIALTVLIITLSAGFLLTMQQARKNNQSIWGASSRRMLLNLFIPLVVGGLFCLILLYHRLVGLVAPATLIFYGLALVHGSKYTLNDIRYLGICEIILGLVGAVFMGYGLLLWTIGFGLLHIIYGTVMHFKYNRKTA